MCNFGDCKREKYLDSDKCILHCDKPEYFDNGWHDAIAKFKESFADYLADVVCSSYGDKTFKYDEQHEYTHQEVKDFFLSLKKTSEIEGGVLFSDNEPPKLLEALKNRAPTIVGIVFPAVQERDEFGYYCHMLEVFGGIEFMRCRFKHGVWLELEKVGVLYFLCVFEGHHNVESHPLFPTVMEKRESSNDKEHSNEVEHHRKLPIYRECDFHDDVNIFGRDEARKKFIRNVFEDCTFHKRLEVDFCLFVNGWVFHNTKGQTKLSTIDVRSCVFDSPFVLKDISVEDSSILDCVFNSRFELTNSLLTNFEVIGCNFNELASISGNRFQEEIRIDNNSFHERIGFDDCFFESNVNFSNTVFKDLSSFSGVEFSKGLNLNSTTFEKSANFFNTRISSEGSTERTFQLIKSFFDEKGILSEANRFFALEKRKRFQELDLTLNTLSEKVVLGFNWLFSDFGQSYVRPIVAFIVVSILAAFTYYEAFDEVFCSLGLMLVEPDFACTGTIPNYLNAWAKGLIFGKLLQPCYEFVSLFYYLFMSIFAWLAIVAFKRLVKR